MAERFEIVTKALHKMLEEKKYAALRDILLVMYPNDIAELFRDVEEEKIPLLFRLLPRSWRQKPLWKWKPRTRRC